MIDHTRAGWRTSSRSSGNGQCVEIAHAPGAVGVRDSKNPTGGVLVVSPARWADFLSGVTSGLGRR